MAPEEKLYIKENLMKLVASGTRPILLEQNHIKDALAKIIVELIKVPVAKKNQGTSLRYCYLFTPMCRILCRHGIRDCG